MPTACRFILVVFSVQPLLLLEESFKKALVIEADDPLAELADLPEVKIGKHRLAGTGSDTPASGSGTGRGSLQINTSEQRGGGGEQHGRTRVNAKPQKIKNVKVSKLHIISFSQLSEQLS